MGCSSTAEQDSLTVSVVSSNLTTPATHTVALIRMDSMGKVTYGGEAFNVRVLVDKLVTAASLTQSRGE